MNAEWDAASGYRWGERIAGRDDVTAVLCGNDEIAIGILAAAKELGVDVPGGLSVTGFDDTPQTEWTTPSLTSVRQPLAGMGRMAVETVLGMAEGTQPASRHVELATTLNVRDSTGPVRDLGVES
jgi:LacI family transcriptional regulator